MDICNIQVGSQKFFVPVMQALKCEEIPIQQHKYWKTNETGVLIWLLPFH